MIAKEILTLLNDQIKIEADSASIYLSMHTWAANHGLEGAAKFLLEQYHEENCHMLKIVDYISNKGCRALISNLDQPEQDFGDLSECFKTVLEHEQFVTSSIHNIVSECRDSGDIATEIFLNWYVTEQIEEEKVALRILDKIKLAGENKAAILEVDNFIGSIR